MEKQEQNESKKRKDNNKYFKNETEFLFLNENKTEMYENKKRKLFISNINELDKCPKQHINKHVTSETNNIIHKINVNAEENVKGIVSFNTSTEIEKLNFEKKENADVKFSPYNLMLNAKSHKNHKNHKIQKVENDERHKKQNENAYSAKISNNHKDESFHMYRKDKDVDSFKMTHPSSLPNSKCDKLYSNKNKILHDSPFEGKHESQIKNEYGLSCSDYYIYNVKNTKLIKYDDAKTLHRLWLTYVSELTESLSLQNLTSSIIYEMELNGAYLEIHKSYCATYIGIKGIVFLETINAFKIVTSQNKIITILKNRTVFKLMIKDKIYYLHGIQLIRDPALKSAKKLKCVYNDWI